MRGYIREIGTALSLAGAGLAGATAGNWLADAGQRYFFRLETDVCDTSRRPLREWRHIPAIEHAVGLPFALASAATLARGMSGTGAVSRLRLCLVMAACVPWYMVSARVVHYTARVGAVDVMTYLPMTAFLAGHWNGSHQRFAVDIATPPPQ